MLSAIWLCPNVNTAPVSKTESKRTQLTVILLIMNDEISFLHSYMKFHRLHIILTICQ
jgi:hypothetical protein